MLASGDDYEVGSTGGEASVILTKANMPKYTITGSVLYDWGTWGGFGAKLETVSSSSTVAKKGDVNSGGSDEAHNNMPPYLSVYCWERIA